mgnify:FL=1
MTQQQQRRRKVAEEGNTSIPQAPVERAARCLFLAFPRYSEKYPLPSSLPQPQRPPGPYSITHPLALISRYPCRNIYHLFDWHIFLLLPLVASCVTTTPRSVPLFAECDQLYRRGKPECALLFLASLPHR